MVPVLFMNRAVRYSVPLTFSVESEIRTIFSWVRSSSKIIDSSAFSSYAYNERKRVAARVRTSSRMRTEPNTELMPLFLRSISQLILLFTFIGLRLPPPQTELSGRRGSLSHRPRGRHRRM